jgi:tetratricopeptide (TPR) repeat protein
VKRLFTLLLLSLAFCTVELTHAQDVAGRLIAKRGQVDLLETDWTPAQLNQDLLEGVQIRTLQLSRAVILLTDETQLKLNANTQLQLNAARQSSGLISRISAAADRTEQSILNLGSGRAYIRSKKTPAELRISTPAVTAAIRGTEFDILVHPDGETVTTVLEGSVDYSNEFGAIILNSGEQGRARVGEAPTKTVIVNPEDAVQWTFFYSAGVSGRDFPFQYDSAAAARSAAETATDPVARAIALHDAGEPESALDSLAGITTVQSDEVRGWLLLESNQLQQALQSLARAGDTPRARLGRSLAHVRAAEFEAALAEVDDPGDEPSLTLQKAYLLSMLGAPEEAEQLLEGLPADGSAGSLVQSIRSTLLLTRNQKEEALTAAQRAVAANPESPTALVALSRVQQSFFELPEATESARRALELAPDFVDARVQYAKLLFGAGLNARAEEVLQPALAAAPEDASVQTLFGFIQLARGRTQDAMTIFEQATALDSTLADPRLGLGLAGMRQGETFDAAADLLAASTLEPRLSLYHSYLAKAFYELREFEQAFSALDTAKELDPRDPTPFLYSGIFEDDLNRPGRAIREYQRSIALNDNRAVYRSRSLLDQDRATRNINLARAYTRLGLAEWGNSEALKSELADASNSSTHNFLANTFLSLPGRTLLAGSESLLARLLQPVNANSFNAFNDYTTLFELPRADFALSGYYGSFDAAGGGLLVTGGARRLAFRLNVAYDKTAGFRPVNDDQKQYTGDFSAKFALTPESDLLVSYSNQQTNQGDHGSAVLVNRFNDENDRTFLRQQRMEVGYHRQLRPGSEVVVVLSTRKIERTLDDPDRLTGNLGIVYGLRESSRQPNIDLQASHILSYDRIQFRYGFDVFEGRRRTLDVLRFQFPGDDEYIFQEFDFTRDKIRYKTAFFRSDYHLHPNLILTTGLNWDWSNDDNRSDAFQNSTSRWNPQGGLLFTPFSRTTFRFAYFQNLQTHLTERVAPTHLYGFPLGQTESEMAHSTTFSLGWDQGVTNSGFFRTYAFWRDRQTPSLDFTERPTLFDGKSYGGRIAYNQFLTDELTLVPQYSITRDLDLFGLRHDHEVSLAMRYVHPLGMYVSLSENFLRQTGRLGFARTHVKAYTTDLEVAWEMPRKIGLASLSVRNLFDRDYEFLVDPLALGERLPDRNMVGTLRFFF